VQTLRTTINPTEEITVDDREALDLERMGLVLTGTRATTDEGLTAAAVRQVTAPPEAPDEDPASPDPVDDTVADDVAVDPDADTSTTADGNKAAGAKSGTAAKQKG
jgi:hypothetical protein